MGFMTASRIISRLLPSSQAEDATFLREAPDRVVLAPDPDLAPSDKPPVRIFVGTEPGQYRAERVFVWSIEQRRDRSRRYEIYLMKDLAGFDRRLWLTGFTNYRFTIPHLAGGVGRAIYNDVDQQYLTDPAELFDLNMDGHGFLAISERDTSVMLIDCTKMKSVWSRADARSGRRKSIEAKARALWGPLAPQWNARDEEYREGESKCIHYTTIHTQPWQPFPQAFVYQRNRVGHVWLDAEREADLARFRLFTFDRPSQGLQRVCEAIRTRHPDFRPHGSKAGRADSPAVLALTERTGARSVLEFGMLLSPGRDSNVEQISARRARSTVTVYDPTERDAPAPAAGFDGVVCTDALELLNDDDVSWVLEELFSRARQFAYVTVRQARTFNVLAMLGRNRRSTRAPAWWFEKLQETGRRYPHVHWQLDLTIENGTGGSAEYRRSGGRLLDGPPKVWVLLDHKPGHTTQSVGLARALGWPFETKEVPFHLLNLATDRLLGPPVFDPGGRRASLLRPPWPDLIVSTGWRTAPISRWIAERSHGATRVIQLGRKGGDVAKHYDAVVTCSHLRLPPDRRRVETLAPINRVTRSELERAAAQWPDLFRDESAPHVVLLVGGRSALHRVDAATAARMGEEVGKWAAAAGGTVAAITSRRTGADVEAALERGLAGNGRVVRWATVAGNNPYLGYLAHADVIVATGDSESMLAEAAATGRPVYVYPVPSRPAGPWRRLQQLVAKIADSRPRKVKGTVRPQQGREYLCARLIESGLVRPPRDVDAMCELMVERGVARRFGDPLTTVAGIPLNEAEATAARIRELLGWTGPEGTPEATTVGSSAPGGRAAV